MQLTTTEATCPLCKHPVSINGVHSDPTRLCEDCQRIVQTIRSTGNARVGVVEPPQARTTLQPRVEIPLPEERLSASPVLDDEERDQFEEEEAISEAHSPEFDAPADAELSLFDFDELFDDGPSINTTAQAAPSYSSEPVHWKPVLEASTAVADPIPGPALQLSSSPRAAAETQFPALAVASPHARPSLPNGV